MLRSFFCALLLTGIQVLGVHAEREASPPIVRGLYVGYMHHYNVGDDAMFEVAQELFGSIGRKLNQTVLLVPFLPPVACNLFKIDFSRYAFIIHGGGSIMGNIEYNCYMKTAKEQKIPYFLFGTGFEANLAGSMAILDLFKSMGRATAKEDLQLSFAEEDTGIMLYLNRVRDTVTIPTAGGFRGYFTKMFVSMLNVEHTLEVIGDSGLLVPRLLKIAAGSTAKDYFEDELMPAALRDKPSGTERFLVAVNYGQNQLSDAIFHTDTEVLDHAFAEMASSLASVHFDVVIYSMSGDDINATFRVYNMALQYAARDWASMGVEDSPEDHIFLMPYVTDSVGILSLLKRAKLSINYKLHANVFSASLGIPFINVAYHFKGEDFSHFLGDNILRDYTIRSSDIRGTKDLVDKVNLLIKDCTTDEGYSSLSHQLKSKALEVEETYMGLVESFLSGMFVEKAPEGS